MTTAGELVSAILPSRFRHALRGAPPVTARHVEWSAVVSVDDLLPAPTEELLDLALAAIPLARSADLSSVVDRCPREDQRGWVRTWPGEHYRLLHALVRAANIGVAVEVGTYTGMGALTLREAGASVVTYDLVPWRSCESSLLEAGDFADGTIEQRLGDLNEPRFLDENRELLAQADLLFIDGPKDGVFERNFLRVLPDLVRPGAIVVVDDIRHLSMLQVWRDLALPKLDMTSFGHFTGTGLAIG